MMTNNKIETNGSITKNEFLTPVDYKILENTCVSEAREPYADYYGKMPNLSNPNSLYLFTKRFYTLDEVQQITCEMHEFFGYTKKLDVATSIFDFIDHYHYALLIKDFPDYNYIEWLQTCYKAEGVAFCKRVHILESAQVTVFKRFSLEKLDEGIYFDKDNTHKGYICLPRQISSGEFTDGLISIRNNTKCALFDAAKGSINIGPNPKYIIRIYSEKLNAALLLCVKQQFTNALLREELLTH